MALKKASNRGWGKYIIGIKAMIAACLIAGCGGSPEIEPTPTPTPTVSPTPTDTPTPTPEPTPMVTPGATTGYTYQAAEYVIDQPDGTTIILRSRGMGQGTSQAYFDIYIEDGLGNVTALRGDPVWFTYDNTTAEAAVLKTHPTENMFGWMPGADENYWLDINGGSDQGGVTYKFHTRATGAAVAKVPFPAEGISIIENHGSTPIHIDTEEGGDVYTCETSNPNNSALANVNGALFWNGSKWVTNDTAAHVYFTDLRNGQRIKEHAVTPIDEDGSAPAGPLTALPGYTVTKNIYNYWVAKNSSGTGVENLGSSYPSEFSVQFTNNEGTICDLHFVPHLVGEAGANGL